jgi:hypothetical protein
LLDKLAFQPFSSRGGATSDGAGTKEANEGKRIQNGNHLETENESGEDSSKDDRSFGPRLILSALLKRAAGPGSVARGQRRWALPLKPPGGSVTDRHWLRQRSITTLMYLHTTITLLTPRCA